MDWLLRNTLHHLVVGHGAAPLFFVMLCMVLFLSRDKLVLYIVDMSVHGLPQQLELSIKLRTLEPQRPLQDRAVYVRCMREALLHDGETLHDVFDLA